MIKKSAILILFLIISSCGPEGYKKGSNGIYFKLLQFGENTEKASESDLVIFSIQLRNAEKVLYDEIKQLKIKAIPDKNSFYHCFFDLSKGDRLSYLIKRSDIVGTIFEGELAPILNDSSYTELITEIIEIQKPEEYLKQKELFTAWANNLGSYEKQLLMQFLDERNVGTTPTSSGLYYIILKAGNGKRIEKGDTIIFHYQGRFLNGKFFDSSKQRQEPFGFIYGEQWQVIPGLEEGIAYMTEGEKALFIIPSDLAFGNSGSSTGIIPPYTSLIFEVDLQEVRKKNIN